MVSSFGFVGLGDDLAVSLFLPKLRLTLIGAFVLLIVLRGCSGGIVEAKCESSALVLGLSLIEEEYANICAIEIAYY